MPFISTFNTILFLFLALVSLSARAQQPFFPSPIPLAVRSPYLTSWDYLKSGNWSTISNNWPATYNSSQILGWVVIVRVDGLSYAFLGDTGPAFFNDTVNSTNIKITPTQTVITAQAGPMQVNLTFLNPIEPGDWVKQSIPFSYMALNARSLDGAAHAIQVYTDISGEWSSGNRDQPFQWRVTPTSDVIYHGARLQTQGVFNEVNSQAEWGTLYYTTKAGTNVTYKVALANDCRGFFVRNGALDNKVEEDSPRIINAGFPLFSLARDFGSLQATEAPFVWAVGLTTDLAVNYTDPTGGQKQRSLYYKSQYSDDETLIVDFLNDFSNASSRAQALDGKILQGAASVSNLLSDLVSIATTKLYGSTQLTIGTDAHGNPDKSDVMVFMKNIGGTNPNRVNPVETLYSAFPALMYIDPSLGAPLLEPLFRLQTFNNSASFAPADLGSTYPNITGGNLNHNQGVEQTGNMLIMTYAHARASGNGDLISKYFLLLTRWADYLTNSTLFIRDQSSADGLSISNQTNLAIKGIIAIEAMSKMCSSVNQTVFADRYHTAVTNLYGQWKRLALGSDQHLLLAYEQANTWTLGYNLYADKWLGTNVVEPSIHDAHSSFIDNLTGTSGFSNFGLPIDSFLSDSGAVLPSWNLFTAAMTQDQNLSSTLISKVHNRVFPADFDTTQGLATSGLASPAQGAMFAPLALKVTPLTISTNEPVRLEPPKQRRTGAIVGAAVAGVAAVLVVIGVAAFVRRQRRLRRRKSVASAFSGAFLESDPASNVTPFDAIPLGSTCQETGSWSERQELLPGSAEAEIPTDSYNLANAPSSVLPRPRPVDPVPAGLSDKELARLRAEAQRTQSRSSPTIANQPRGATSGLDARRLESEVESLRREMQELRAERLEAPPSYTDGGAV